MIGAITGRGIYTESSWPFHIVDLNCTGSEPTLFVCPHNNLIDLHNCISTHDASVRCQGNRSGLTYYYPLITIIILMQLHVLTLFACRRDKFL